MLLAALPARSRPAEGAATPFPVSGPVLPEEDPGEVARPETGPEPVPPETLPPEPLPPETSTDPADELPLPPVSETSQPPAGVAVPLEIELTANRQEYDAQQRRFVATGNVEVRVAGGRLQADRLEYDPVARSLYAYGSVRFQRGQQYFQASRLHYSLLEGSGEMEDVYGVLDLDGSSQDLDPDAVPTAPLPPAEPLSCPPAVPPPAEWHPYPWAVTAWGGQMFAAPFGDTFLGRGNFRPEYLAGLGLQRRLLQGGPLALEIDGNLMGHRAARQPGGGENQSVPFADTPSQTFAEGTLGIGLRLWVQPWLSLYFVEGVSLLSESSNYEKTFRENYSNFLNYLAFEVEALVSPRWSAVGRIHHRSGAFGTYSGVSEGSNAYLLGVRYRLGESADARIPLPLPPPQGCPGAPEDDAYPLPGLARQLERVTMGEGFPSRSPTPSPAPPSSPSGPEGDVWSRARRQEQARREAIARIDQRVRDVTFQQSLVAERRFGAADGLTSQIESSFGGVRPSQLDQGRSGDRTRFITGTLSRWRVQARRVRITPTTFSGDRIGFANDPFTPAQSWIDSRDVVGTLQPNGDTVIKARSNRLWLEDRLPLPVTRSTTIRKEKEEEVTNRWVLGYDQEDRDGFFLGYEVPVRIGDEEKTRVYFQPQFMLERAISSSTDSYPPPGDPVDSGTKEQPADTSDLFGFVARVEAPVAGGFDLTARGEVTTFNPENIPDGTRAFGELKKDVDLPLVGDSKLRLFGAYRLRVWNGSLGEQDVYTAYGVSVEDEGKIPFLSRFNGGYFWRAGLGNYRAEAFDNGDLTRLWRGNLVGSLNLDFPLWTGKPAPATASEGLASTPTPIVPGLKLRTNLFASAAYFGDGSAQNTLSISGGPTLTLGHFVKPFLDYTELSISGSATLRGGGSPLSFDRAVDLGTLGIGLTQQIAGPLVFNGGVGLNVDPGSEFYGEVTGSYLELRWQRRSYEIGVYYSPYDGLGGVRVKLNDFNFRGPGLPYVPLDPVRAAQQRPF